MWFKKKIKSDAFLNKRINEDVEKARIYREQEPERRNSALKYWTPELLEWISSTNDPLKLSIASLLVNCMSWPKWLPSRPDNYYDYFDERDDGVRLHFTVELFHMLKNKAELISPGLYKKVHNTKLYQKDEDYKF